MNAHRHWRNVAVRIPIALAISVAPVGAGTVIWDDSDSTALWSTANNWDTNVEPTSADDLIFPVALGGSISLASGEQALSLLFNDSYTLTAGTLTLATGNSVEVPTGQTATINSSLIPTDGLSKIGDGILVLAGSNTSNSVGNDIAAGTLRITHNNGLGGASSVTTVNDGTILEIANGLSQSRNISLLQGGTIAGIGTATNNGIITIDAAATSVTLATDGVSDVFTAGTGLNDLTGGSAATVIDIGGPGAVRLNTDNNYAGSWDVPTGVLEAATAKALGDQNTSSVTLSGGTLSARRNSAANYATASPAANLTLTADSTLRSDRTSNGGGATHTMGVLLMGANTLTVEPGPMVISGTAGITLGDVTLSGDPILAVNDNAGGNGKLTTGSLLGGAVARIITKTGAGDLAVNGGATDLPAGSSFTATGGGTIEMRMPNLGSDPTVTVTAAQNSFGESTISVTDGGLRLLANGSGNSTAQTYVLSSPVTLGGTLTLDADRQSGSSSNKTFELPSLTLAAGTDLTMSGDHTHGISVTGPVALSGDATLRGINITSRDGLLAFDGGITGAGSDALTIEGGTSPLNLTVNAAGTYGGGTTMNGSKVTLNAADGFGTGQTTMNGGTLTLNAAAALSGTVNANGGTIRVNGVDFLAANPVVLNGGAVDFRDNASGTILTGGLIVSGTSTLGVGRNTSGSSQVFDFPALTVSGDTTLTLTQANNFQPNFLSIDLLGNLTLSHPVTTRIQSIVETGSARTLIKDGNGTLELEGANTHTGGTEVIDGILLVQDVGALGTGALTIGDTTGNEAATARFDAGLTIANDLVARAGGTGNLTLDASAGNVTWDGEVDLQRTLRIDNGSSVNVSTLNGQITGAGGLNKVSAGEIVLSDATNSFGSGAADDVTITDGRLTVASDSALGNAANGVTLGGSDGVLKIDGTFASSRSLTFTGTATGVAVTGGNDFTMNAPLLGTGAFIKSDAGTFILPPGTDNTARGSATTGVTGGILRVQDEKGLSDAGLVTMNSNSTPFGILELLRDPDTNFGHPLTANGTSTVHVDRAIGGTGTNGRHTLGALTTISGKLTVTGDNGYGLTLGDYLATANPTLTNEAPGALILPSITGNPGTSTRTLTVGGSGDILVSGAFTQGAGTGTYRLAKNGEGTFRLGTSVTGFGARTTVRDGVFDLNGLTYLSNDLDLGGAPSVTGARILTGAGSLQLSSGLSFFSANPAPEGAVITGTVDLGSAASPFVINNSGGAAVDTTVEGPILGIAGSSLTKSGSGTLRFTGAGNTYPGLTAVTSGDLELGKSSGDGVGTGGLSVSNADVILLASEQINDAGTVLLSGTNSDTRLELDSFTETVGPLTIEQIDAFDYAGVRTGASGTLVLAGDLVLSNNSNSSGTDARNILITGTGTDTVPTTDGTLDLGGVNRTINVTTTTVGVNEPDANATIETQIINGGIIKTGPRCLFLNHPTNTFAGGIQIFEGSITPATLASLGTGGVSFANTGTASAGIDLGGITGTLADDFNISGSGTGTTTITYSGPKPNALTLSGAFTLERDLTFDVVNGSVNDGDTATLDVTGLIDDGVNTASLVKMGNGTLKLAAGNTYSGSTTVEGGLLSIPADSALGDGAGALTIDGGVLDAGGTFALGRDLTFGANGGSVRVDDPNTLTIPGTVTWGSSPSAFFGSGATILSGTTSGSGSDLLIGNPTDFADTSFNPNVGLGHVLSLRGTAVLPTGNLSIVKNAVLELGTGDFTRALGTGPGELEMKTNKGGGWAAYGADRIVNIGGAGATLTWGQQSPAFLHAALAGSDYGDLILGSATATHTIDFQNPIDLDSGTTGVFRAVVVNDGAAALDAEVSGGITQSAVGAFTSLAIEGDGSIEISGPIGSEIGIANYTTGTLTLSGTNSLNGNLETYFGTLVIASDAAFGAPADIFFEDGSTIDASGMTVPLGVPAGGFFSVNANLTGSVETASYFEGNGSISGDLHLLPGGNFFPNTGGQLQVAGDFTFDATANAEFFVNGLVPDSEYNRMDVTGTVTLAGDLSLSGSGLSIGDAVVLITNDGTDPIVGTFAGFPEGAPIPLGDGIALIVTYLANGDGGSVGNDFGVSAVEDTFSTDLFIDVDQPLAVDLSAPIDLTYNIFSSGDIDVTDAVLTITLPGNATFVGSTPAGTLNASELTIPLPTLFGIDSTSVTLNLTAPAVTSTVFVEATVSSSSPEVNLDDNDAPTLTAVFSGGTLMENYFDYDSLTNTMSIGIDTVDGVEYLLETSTTLEPPSWFPIYYFTGNGLPFDYMRTYSDPERFFRFRIRPYDDNGGGKE